MNDLKDELAATLNGAFEDENLVFDMQAWYKMEALLNQRYRRRAFWIWLNSLIGFLGVSALTLWLINPDHVYKPRVVVGNESIANIYQQLNEETNPIRTEQRNNTRSLVHNASDEANQIQVSSKSNAEDETRGANKNEVIDTNNSLDTKIKVAGIPGQLANELSNPIKEIFAAVADSIPNGIMIESTLREDSTATALGYETTKRAFLNGMQLLELEPLITKQLQQREWSESPHKSTWHPYLVFGLSSILESGFKTLPIASPGQTFALGAAYQFRPHLLFNAEVLVGRDMVDYRYTQKGIKYGFGYQGILRTTQVTEMLIGEIPIMINYRYGRFKIGSGASFGSLLSSKLNEETTISDAPTNASSEQKQRNNLGYMNWTGQRKLLVSIPVSSEYQLNEKYHAGIRYQFGLIDAFSANNGLNRKNRLSIYLKLNLD